MYVIRKIRGKNLFSVKNSETGKIHSHETTKANAKKQVKLLQAIDHGFIPSGNSKDLDVPLEQRTEFSGGYFGESLVNAATNLYNRTTRSRRGQVAPVNDQVNPLGPYGNHILPRNTNGSRVAPEPTISLDQLFGNPQHNNRGNQIVPINVTPEMIYDAWGMGPNTRGSGRMNSAVKTMITYLKSLYPSKTLISVANEILKLTGHMMTGRGRKPIKTSEIAKYVIGAIGTALAVIVANILLNREEETEYPEDSLLSKGLKYQQEEKKKRDEEYRKGVAERTKQMEDRKKLLTKSTSDLEGGCFGINCFRNRRRRIVPIQGESPFVTTVIDYVDRHPGQFNRIVYNWEHNHQALIDDINETGRIISIRRRNPQFYLNRLILPLIIRDINNSQNLQDIPIGQEDLYNYRGQRRPQGRHETEISNGSSSSSSTSSDQNRPPSPTGSGRRRSKINIKSLKSTSDLEGGMFGWLSDIFGNRRRVAPTGNQVLRRIHNNRRIVPTEAIPVLDNIPIADVNIDNRRPGTPIDTNIRLPEATSISRGRGRKRKEKKRR